MKAANASPLVAEECAIPVFCGLATGADAPKSFRGYVGGPRRRSGKLSPKPASEPSQSKFDLRIWPIARFVWRRGIQLPIFHIPRANVKSPGASWLAVASSPIFERRKQEGAWPVLPPSSVSVGQRTDILSAEQSQLARPSRVPGSTWPQVPIESAGLLACPTQTGVLEAQEA